MHVPDAFAKSGKRWMLVGGGDLREASFMRRADLTAGLALVLGALCLALAPASAAAPPPWTGPEIHPFTIDPGNAACVPWDDPTLGQIRDCDPVNVIFPRQ